MKLIELNISKILDLCRHYKVKTLYVFGSILTSRFKSDSDIDLLVRFKKDEISLSDYADNFLDFQFALESLLNRKIDLVCEDSITNPYFRQEVDTKKRLIYGPPPLRA